MTVSTKLHLISVLLKLHAQDSVASQISTMFTLLEISILRPRAALLFTAFVFYFGLGHMKYGQGRPGCQVGQDSLWSRDIIFMAFRYFNGRGRKKNSRGSTGPRFRPQHCDLKHVVVLFRVHLRSTMRLSLQDLDTTCVCTYIGLPWAVFQHLSVEQKPTRFTKKHSIRKTS